MYKGKLFRKKMLNLRSMVLPEESKKGSTDVTIKVLEDFGRCVKKGFVGLSDPEQMTDDDTLRFKVHTLVFIKCDPCAFTKSLAREMYGLEGLVLG